MGPCLSCLAVRVAEGCGLRAIDTTGIEAENVKVLPYRVLEPFSQTVDEFCAAASWAAGVDEDVLRCVLAADPYEWEGECLAGGGVVEVVEGDLEGAAFEVDAIVGVAVFPGYVLSGVFDIFIMVLVVVLVVAGEAFPWLVE